MATTSVSAVVGKALPINRYHKGDSPPNVAVDINSTDPKDLKKLLRLGKSAVDKLAQRLRKEPISDVTEFLDLAGRQRRDYEKLRRCAITSGDSRFSILDVKPAKQRLWSYKPIQLKIDILNPAAHELILIEVHVLWQGTPFVVEQILTPRQSKTGSVLLKFNDAQTLPPGPATFLVSLYDAEGGMSAFRTTCVVLPSNPLTLSISPRTYFVTGTYSIRGYYNSAANNYITDVYVNIYNGNANSVTINRTGNWEFWNGGVGGTRIESGNVSWSNNISISPYSTWTGTIRFTSPSGSGVYNTYDDKEDMTLKIQMTSTTGTIISDTLTCRVMLGYGLDIIRVASDSFIGQEHTDLYDAVDVCQDIYEARDITFRGVGRYHIDDADAGSYDIINSQNECRDMFSDWSAASGGSYIDVFVCHDFSGTGFDGLAGDIPGPTSHSGRKSGVAVDKTGYVDAGGTRRLHVDYLGMLIGHELGHYLGLSHLSVAGNLMHPSSGTYDTNLTYDQYRDTLGFGWLYVV